MSFRRGAAVERCSRSYHRTAPDLAHRRVGPPPALDANLLNLDPLPGQPSLRLHTDQTAVVVPGRKALLARMLGNLLDNAERHAHRTITIHVRHDGPTAVLEVRDDGPGIPPQVPTGCPGGIRVYFRRFVS